MILDTNILIAYLAGEIKVVQALLAWRASGAPLFVSAISVTETLSHAPLRSEEIIVIERFLNDLIIIYPDATIIRLAAELRRMHTLSLPDAYITASAMTQHVPLITRDKHLLKLGLIPTITL